MSQTYEDLETRRMDQEERRLDLAERQLVLTEKLSEGELAKYQQGIDNQIADRAERRAQRETEHADWQTHRRIVEEGNRVHGELLERVAVALEQMVEAGASLQ
jgi:hypothetical protein